MLGIKCKPYCLKKELKHMKAIFTLLEYLGVITNQIYCIPFYTPHLPSSNCHSFSYMYVLNLLDLSFSMRWYSKHDKQAVIPPFLF